MKCCSVGNNNDSLETINTSDSNLTNAEIMNITGTLLKTLTLFDGIPEKEYPALIEMLEAGFEKKSKGDYLYKCCDQSSQISILLTGMLHGVQFDDVGNRSIIQTFRAPEAVGLPLSFGFEVLYMNIIAALSSVVMIFPCENLSRLIDSENIYARKLFWNISRLQTESSIQMKTRISVLSKRNTREKILYYLKKEAQYCHSLNFKIPLSRQELADYLFVERTALSHQLSQLKKEGYFDYSQNEFSLNSEHFNPD